MKQPTVKEVTDSKEKKYQFNIKNYSGSLDLLLSLVRDKKMSIFEINLVELADQYLAIIDELKNENIDLASDYLLMAATLLQIKSASLLNPQELPEEIEEDKDRLLRRLAEYKAFKEIVEVLRVQEIQRKDIFMKKAKELDEYVVKPDLSILDGHSNPMQIAIVLRKMFERNFAYKLRNAKFETFTLTASDQAIYIQKMLANRDAISFAELFNLPSLNHFVITLLALLDLARRQEIILRQDEQFEEIFIYKGELYEQQ